MAAAAEPTTAEVPAVVLFGRDDAGKCHASHFAEREVAVAQRAAKLMGMSVLPLTTDDERALAARVPRGRIFGSGKAFAPFVKTALFQELQTAAVKGGHGAPPDGPNRRAKFVQPDATPPSKQPTSWDDIQVGAIVLAAVAPRYLDWAEVVVTDVENGDLRLRYCDWPTEPEFVRQRSEVALMHATYQPEPPLEPTA